MFPYRIKKRAVQQRLFCRVYVSDIVTIKLAMRNGFVHAGRIMQHYKGKRYTVLGIARHTENSTAFVAYHPLDDPQDIWVRPVDMFNSYVKIDGVVRPRFSEVVKRD